MTIRGRSGGELEGGDDCLEGWIRVWMGWTDIWVHDCREIYVGG